MKQSELIALIELPHKAAASDLQKVEALKNEFPFFQSAHMLLTFISRKYDSSLYQQTLRSTAISIPNRARLYNLLNEAELQEETSDIPVTVQEEKQEVKVETVSPVVEVKETPVEIKAEEITPVEEKAAEKIQPEVQETSEIEHLKAIELVTESPEQRVEEELNRQVEKEIEKQIVNAFIEKEVLKTPELHKPEPKKKELEAGSFSDWLQALKNMDRDAAEEPVNVKKEEPKPVIQPRPKSPDKKEEQKSIIDKIIESNPGNIRLNPNQKFFAPDIKAKESLFENEDLVTETLAKIYALQGNISKAVRAYEILSLKFPQKSAYFASLIENLKKGNQ